MINILSFFRERKSPMYWRIISLLSIAGLLIAGYLLKLDILAQAQATGGANQFCDISSGWSCSTVAVSKYSSIFGVPVALLGAIAYFIFAIGAIIFANIKKIPRIIWWAWIAAILAGIAFTFRLTYAELFIIKSICIFCVTQQIILLVMAILHYPIYKELKRS
jgi:uncharacterized membrane protein